MTRSKKMAPLGLASVSALAALSVNRSTQGAPAYNIYPFPLAGGYSTMLGQAVSQDGTYAAGVAFTVGAGNASGVLYNIPSGTAVLEAQTGVTYGRGVVEYTGSPAAVTTGGIMFGSSGAGSTVTTGAPTVWNNGHAANLPLPIGSGGGQVYAANNLNEAVGSIKLSSAGADQAAIWFYNSTTPSSSYAAVLTGAQTTNGGTLQDAFGINDSNVIVGTADDPNNAALDVPFMLTLGNSSATIIPNAPGNYNGGIPFAISDSGLVTGAEQFYSGSGQPFIYNSSTNTTSVIPLAPNSGEGEGRGINNSGEVVGTDGGLYAVPFLYDGTNTYDLQTLLSNNASGLWQLDDNTSSGAWQISDNGIIVGRGMYNGALTAYVMVPTGATLGALQQLTWNNAGGSGNGTTWDGSNQNWNNGSGATTFSGTNHDYVTFNDSNNGNYNISIPATVTPGQVTFNFSSGNYTLSGAGGIGGTPIIYKFGSGTLIIDTVNTYTTPTNIYGGTVILGVKGALPSGTQLTVSGSSNNSTTVIVSSLGAPYAMTLASVDAYGNGSLDIMNNALVLTNVGYFSSIYGQVKDGFAGGLWNGYSNSSNNYPPGIDYSGIISSMAGTAHPLMAIGIILNDNGSGTPLYGTGGSIASTFEGATPVDGNILVKYTYYGDANLDGKVDGSDYTRLDFAYTADAAYLAANPTGTAQPNTGWYNGDFNYDGYVNGSDYTLMDNAFNAQGAAMNSELAYVTTEIAPATSAVPEPGLLCQLLPLGLAALRRRSNRRPR